MASHISMTVHGVPHIKAEWVDLSKIENKQIVSRASLRIIFGDGLSDPQVTLFDLPPDHAEAYAAAINECRKRLAAAQSEAA